MNISFASVYYYPFLGKLLHGEHSSCGLTLLWSHVFPPFKLFGQLIHSRPYDVAEMSLSTYTMLRQQGWCNYVALPVFTSRCFRHSSLYVLRESDITNPLQLKGGRVGVPEYHMTAAVWLRGFLSEDFGLHPEEVTWHTGGLEEPGRRERIELPDRLSAEIIPIGQNETLFGLLLEGRLDAVLSPHIPTLLRDRPAQVRRLFVDPAEVEKEYYRTHGVFPIMHTVVVRQDLCGDNADIPLKVYRILKKLKEDFYSKVRMVDRTLVLPWLDQYLEQVEAVLGKDLWPYGLAANARTLNKYLEHAFQQGLLDHRPQLNDLFIDINE